METEKNEVVVIAHNTNFRLLLNPDIKYCFNPSCCDTIGSVITVLYCETYPVMKK